MLRTAKCLLVFVVLLALVCCASVAFAATYNMTNDWTFYPDEPANWDFGTKVETGSGTGVFGSFQSGVHENSIWWLDRYVVPNTYDSCWVGFVTYPGWEWIYADKVSGSPWTTYAAVVHFTGAEAGYYNLSATFLGLLAGTKTVYVQVNGSTVWSQTISGLNTASTPSDQPLVWLTPTDYVDFIVADSGTSGCTTEMDATLVPVAERPIDEWITQAFTGSNPTPPILFTYNDIIKHIFVELGPYPYQNKTRLQPHTVDTCLYPAE